MCITLYILTDIGLAGSHELDRDLIVLEKIEKVVGPTLLASSLSSLLAFTGVWVFLWTTVVAGLFTPIEKIVNWSCLDIFDVT